MLFALEVADDSLDWHSGDRSTLPPYCSRHQPASATLPGMGKKKKDKFFNPDLRLTEEEEAERRLLEEQLDEAISQELKSKEDQAKYWAALRPFYSKPGCKGKWRAFVASKGSKISTVNGLIKRLGDGWEESGRKPKPRPNQPNSGRLKELHLAFTEKPYSGDEGILEKEILEAAFLLTKDEKDQFMEALRIITPEKGLEIMFQSVVDYVERQRTPAGSFSDDEDNL